MGDAGDVTQLLAAISGGDGAATDDLLPLVYEELRSLARHRLAAEPPGHTLQATALVHEAYLRLLGGARVEWNGRGHFFAAAAEAMRRILVERARRYQRLKHGGGRRRVPLRECEIAARNEAGELLGLDAALRKLQAQDRRMYDVAMLRHFAGLTNEQTALALDVSERSVSREWRCARLWLIRAMEDDGHHVVEGAPGDE